MQPIPDHFGQQGVYTLQRAAHAKHRVQWGRNYAREGLHNGAPS